MVSLVEKLFLPSARGGDIFAVCRRRWQRRLLANEFIRRGVQGFSRGNLDTVLHVFQSVDVGVDLQELEVLPEEIDELDKRVMGLAAIHEIEVPCSSGFLGSCEGRGLLAKYKSVVSRHLTNVGADSDEERESLHSRKRKREENDGVEQVAGPVTENSVNGKPVKGKKKKRKTSLV